LILSEGKETTTLEESHLQRWSTNHIILILMKYFMRHWKDFRTAKSAVLLRDYEGYSYKEIGEVMGLSEAQVKINIYRGRLSLKNYIGTIETVI